MNAPFKTPPRRVLWIAGTRAAILTLAPAFNALRRDTPPIDGWLYCTGEEGMAASQALDLTATVANEIAELCHPADEPAIRLNQLLERIEAYARRHRATHLVFSGHGPGAAAAALFCHARRARGLWLRPADPAGVVMRLDWESGLARIVQACAPLVKTVELGGVPSWPANPAISPSDGGAHRLPDAAIAGRRAGAPLIIVAILRREWGISTDTTDRLARAVNAWAREHSAADILVISNLNARIEAPLRSLVDCPANLIVAPPLPYPVFQHLLANANAVLTDSPTIAAEALRGDIALATLGDRAHANEANEDARILRLVPSDLSSDALQRFIAHAASVDPARRRAGAAAKEYLDVGLIVRGWLAEAAR